jgi:hypothetical protein
MFEYISRNFFNKENKALTLENFRCFVFGNRDTCSPSLADEFARSSTVSFCLPFREGCFFFGGFRATGCVLVSDVGGVEACELGVFIG